MSDPDVSRMTLVRRGLRRRCPRCGGKHIFSSFLELHERCPHCGMRFEREPGYWVGAMIIITIITFGLFLLLLVGGALATWPDVPWNVLFAVTVGANLVVPFVAYPTAKTLWAALEMSWHPLEPGEVTDADQFLADR